MIELIWSGKSKLYWLLLPLSWLYGLISTIRRFCYQRGWFSSWRAPIAVVVVGNLTAGGSGKTPTVIWLVEQLGLRGLRAGVVSRGYGGNAKQYPLVLDETTTTAEAGDEPVLIYQRTHAAVAVAPKRAEAIKALLATQTLDVIITDDGLQHYALQRDIELVVIDGERRFGNGWWLPAGPMRERAGRLTSVDAAIVNGGQAGTNEILMQLVAGQAINLLTGERKPVSELNNVVAMAGIGHPPRFFNTLSQLGLRVKQQHAFQDHQAYTEQQLLDLIEVQDNLLMTEKDAVKCRAFAHQNWWYLPVDAQISEDKGNQLLAKIVTAISQRRG